MGRKSIINEGGTPSDSNDVDDGDSSERHQFTLRLPIDLVDDLDDWADERGMPRNAAISFLLSKELSD